jgi:hypothetical protein
MALIQQKIGFQDFWEILKIAQKNIFKPKFAYCAAWLIYELLENNDFYKNKKHFEKLFFGQKAEIYKKNIEALFKVIEDSQPKINDKKASKIKEYNDENEKYFSKSYAIIAKEIGFTINQFYDLTLRQIRQIQEDLSSLKNQDLEFQANIHGAKVIKQSDNRPNSEINFSKKENKVIEDFAKKRMREMIYERKKQDRNI